MSASKGEGSSSEMSFINPDQVPFLNELYKGGSKMLNKPKYKKMFRRNVLKPSMAGFAGIMQGQGNPELLNQIQIGTDLINENYTENILPTLGSNAAMVGQRGSGRQGVAQGIAAREAMRQQSDLTSNMLAQDYAASQDRILQALSLAPSLGGLPWQPMLQQRAIVGNPTVLNQGRSSEESKGLGISF